jgi:hypothetical protein
MNLMPLRILGQGVIYTGFALLIAHFSQAPAYHPIPDGYAQIKLSFAHGGKPKGGCRQRTAGELANLAPNMRKATLCPRERVPVVVQFTLDNTPVFEASLPPTGLRGDGASQTYRKFLVPSGAHRLTFKLRDSERAAGFDYAVDRAFELKPGQNLAVDFDAQAGGFVFRNGPHGERK